MLRGLECLRVDNRLRGCSNGQKGIGRSRIGQLCRRRIGNRCSEPDVFGEVELGLVAPEPEGGFA
ncbi:hypothetical protein Pyn_21923 [Prunus yedoensis var. nudiflora]|uniref:Uncharacterized protein n=1 Tax=Prunus yedoensis var. nudiflora TaxID=2094558 RepID=A0A314U9U2_PRUYE|nr:hypothetical protein Pyn_21923 [Prunus yedoensis var. nudiflora]